MWWTWCDDHLVRELKNCRRFSSYKAEHARRSNHNNFTARTEYRISGMTDRIRVRALLARMVVE